MGPSLRHATALPLAILVTLGLVWLMKSLVSVRSIADELQAPPARIVFVSRDREELDNPEPPAPEPQAEPEPEPPPPEPELARVEPPPRTETPAVPVPEPEEKRPEPEPQPKPRPRKSLPPKPETKAPARAPSVAARARFDSTPLYRPKPSYPNAARRKGQEGWVLVGFTVTRSGGVSDVRVISSSPRGVFDQAALGAVRRWRYQPQPVDRPGQRSRIRFQLR